MVVEITKDGIKETLGKGNRFETLPRQLKELKLSTIRELPSLIERSKLDDDRVPNYHNADSVLKYAYLSSDITVEEGTPYTVTITVRKSPQKNKFWIHEIRAIKKGQGLSSSEVIDPQQEYNKTLAPDDIISQPSDSVKSKNSERNKDSMSNRAILANAIESSVQTEIERKKLQDYRENIDSLYENEAKLSELNRQIKELSFAEGKRDANKLKELREEAVKTANRINIYDKKLLRLEPFLSKVLDREKVRVRKQEKTKYKESLAEYREKRDAREEAMRAKCSREACRCHRDLCRH